MDLPLRYSLPSAVLRFVTRPSFIGTFNFRRRILGALVLTTMGPLVAAQDLGPVAIPSPNAAAIERFTNIPVNHYTGVPGISIPLYTIAIQDAEIPIVMRYHAVGIRPNEFPSWVGLNWALDAGGQITREVKWHEDERNNLGRNTDFTFNLGYYYNGNELNDNDWSSFADLSIYNDLNSLKDTEPDIFHFSFPGASGEFFLGPDGKWRVRSENNVRVDFDEQDIVPYDPAQSSPVLRRNIILKFTLVLDDGTQFVFGGTREAIEFTRPPNPERDQGPVATTWRLTEVITLDGRTIHLEYERNKDDLILQPFYNYAIDDRDLLSGNGPGCTSTNTTPSYGSRVIEPSYLARIYTQHEELTFSSKSSESLPLDVSAISNLNLQTQYNDAYEDIAIRPTSNATSTYHGLSNSNPKAPGRTLTKIVIDRKSSQGSFQDMTIDFLYNDEVANPTRLLPLRVTIAADCRNCTRVYDLAYYDHAVVLPGYTTQRVDHWGYYNASEPVLPQFPNTESILTDPAILNAYVASRDATNDPLLYEQDMLKTITYPTGGTSQFRYEPHTYSTVLRRVPLTNGNGGVVGFSHIAIEDQTTIKRAGGLRIAQIETQSEIGPNVIRNYTYGKDYQPATPSTLSSGQLQNPPLYLKEFTLQNGSTVVGTRKVFSISPILPLKGTEASHVVYEEVVENTNGSGSNYYKYSITKEGDRADEAPVNSIGNDYYDELTSLHLERGKLLESTIFTEAGDKREENFYTYNDATIRFDDKVRSRSFGSDTYCGDAAYSEQGVASYLYYYNYFLKTHQKVTYGQLGGALTTRVDYEYGGPVDRLIKAQTTTDSEGEEKRQTYTYAFELSTAPEGTCTLVYDKLKCQNNLRALREENTFQDNVLTTTLQHDYGDFGVTDLGTFLIKKSETKSAYGSNILSTDITYDNYDLRGNLLQYTPRSGVVTSYLWGYERTRPVARVEGASYSAVTSSLTATQLSSLDNYTLTDPDLRSNLAGLLNIDNALVMLYSHNPLFGITSQTAPNGLVSYYEYDDLGRFHRRRDHQQRYTDKYLYHYQGQVHPE